MFSTVDAQTFRNGLGDMINRVQYRGESITVTRSGAAVATLIDPDLFTRVHAMQGRLTPLAESIARAFEEIPVEDGIENLKTLVAELRASSQEG
ncbi:hypothetical protein WV31_04730 [Magnetospirillum sp. ME-1]|uniref:type II toxin-antitoxin system Phd/YefM family antitoxin n=1 Tax=Magnetospirillum sp. ME-1 TaxID=1639348 RepID=UPI000A17EC83|nr:type II toxin-antitoxin system prevent-host-death family antitoxin [Magnetospirillum sp. ME-1]ARJ65019.1 hypothetical protein WV31_04730 [Magnetospirillum sp. ME-1]